MTDLFVMMKMSQSQPLSLVGLDRLLIHGLDLIILLTQIAVLRFLMQLQMIRVIMNLL